MTINQELERPILIGGAPSSGTTLLSVMLDAHPQIACGPELSIFSHAVLFKDYDFFKSKIKEFYQTGDFDIDPVQNLRNGFCPYHLIDERNLDFYDLNTSDFLKILMSSNSSHDLAETIFKPFLEKKGKRIWAEKTPSNIYGFEAFLDAYPDGYVVYMVRDMRDLVCSLLRRGFSFKKALSIWLVETAICENFRRSQRVFPLRYEDLILKPHETIENLLRFLGVSINVDQVLDYYHKSERVLSDHTLTAIQSWKNNPTQPLSRKSIGIWSQQLSPEQLAILYSAYIAQPNRPYLRISQEHAEQLLRNLEYDVHIEKLNGSKAILFQLLFKECLLVCGDLYSPQNIFHERFVMCNTHKLSKISGVDESSLQDAKSVSEQAIGHIVSLAKKTEADHARLHQNYYNLYQANQNLQAECDGLHQELKNHSGV